jgi:hypothetical protein
MSKKVRETVVVVAEETNEPQEVVRGDRGNVGEATPSLTIKQLWHEATHVLEEVGDAHNPRKQEWVRKAGTPSLKRYARQLLASGDALAKDWFAHKHGAMNASRSDANKTRASLERQATKASRRKRADGNKTKAKTAEVTAVKQ